jgi:hypothetical protein
MLFHAVPLVSVYIVPSAMGLISSVVRFLVRYCLDSSMGDLPALLRKEFV